MNKKNSLAMLILCLASAGALIFSPASGGQESQRGECQKACTKTYQECRQAAGADQAACKTAFDECRKTCKDVDPHPSPTPTPTDSPTPTPTPSPAPGF